MANSWKRCVSTLPIEKRKSINTNDTQSVRVERDPPRGGDALFMCEEND